jgi:hypothetical protein
MDIKPYMALFDAHTRRVKALTALAVGVATLALLGVVQTFLDR